MRFASRSRGHQCIYHEMKGFLGIGTSTTSVLEKALKDRTRGNFERAFRRLEDGLKKDPKEVAIYKALIDTALESGDSRLACQFFRDASKRVPDRFEELLRFATHRVGTYDDSFLATFLFELTVNARKLEDAESVLAALKDHTAAEALKRFREKSQNIANSSAGHHTLKRDLANRSIAEALLCLRGRLFGEAAKLLVGVLDQDAREHEYIEPFLVHAERRIPRQGEIAYALGCAHAAARRYPKAVEKLVKGATTAPALAAASLARLEAMQDEPSVSREHLDLSLARLYLVTGRDDQADRCIRAIREDRPFKSPALLDLIKHHLDDDGERRLLDYLFVDVSLAAGKTDLALKRLKWIYKHPKHRTDFVRWLDRKTQQQFLPVEILLFLGQMMLEEGMGAKAVEIFRDILNHAPGEAPAVRDIIENYDSDPAVRELASEISVPQTRGGTFDVEHFGQREFTLSDSDPEPAESEPVPPTDPEIEPATTDDTCAESNDDDNDIVRDVEHFFGDAENEYPTGEPGENDEPLVAERPADVEPDAPVQTDTIWPDPIDVQERAVDLPESVPSLREDATVETPTSDFDPDVETTSKESGREDDVGETHQDASQPEDFDTLYFRFKQGTLAHDEILGLAALGSRIGKWDELKELLKFEPKNLAEEIERKRLLAEYYSVTDQPLSALVVLKTVQLNTLSRAERRKFLIKIADCYKSLNRFDAAHSVYLRLISENPDVESIEMMARQNYENYLRDLSGCAPVLERVTSV